MFFVNIYLCIGATKPFLRAAADHSVEIHGVVVLLCMLCLRRRTGEVYLQNTTSVFELASVLS